jgi:DNA-binding NarL/FixJ family response regulator
MKSESPALQSAEKPLLRVVLVDDHVSMRQMMRVVLRLDGGVEVVGEASGGCEALRVCREVRPDLVVLDLALGDLMGGFVLEALREAVPGVRVVVYTGSEDAGLLRGVLRMEPEGFVRKTDDLQLLRLAIGTVGAGGRFWSPSVSGGFSRPEPRLERLSVREVAVLQLIARGLQSKEIAEVLDSKVKTVDHHRQSLMDKLGLHDVASLTRFAVANGLCGV